MPERGGPDAGLRAAPGARPGRSERPLPAEAPEQSEPGGSRPGLAAAASDSVLAGRRDCGMGRGPWESSSGILAARSSEQHLRVVSILTRFGGGGLWMVRD